MTTTGTAGADDPAAAAMTDTDHAAPRTSAGPGGLRVRENLVDGCMEEVEAGVVRMTDTDQGLEENPEGGLDHAPDPRLRKKTSTRLQPPITPRTKCDEHIPLPAPGPGPYQDRAPVRVLGPDLGPDASQEDTRKYLLPPVILIPAEGLGYKWLKDWSFTKKKKEMVCLYEMFFL